MLHAINIHHHPDISSLVPSGATPRLTVSQIEARTSLQRTDATWERYLGTLSWVEDAHMASLQARTEFINRLCDYVTNAGIARDRPLTLVSLGAGCLLTEALIHDQLQQAGYTDIRWRVIDVGYINDGFRAARLGFVHRVKEKVAAFTTEQAYFNKVVGGERLAMTDRAAGASIVLCIAPPASPGMLNRITPDANGESVIGVRGQMMEDVTKANAVALYIGLTPQQTHAALDARNETMCWTSGLLRLYIQDGKIEFDTAAGKMGNDLRLLMGPNIQRVVASVPAGQAIGLAHADRAAAAVAQAFEGTGKPTSRAYVSDYDVSCTHLRAHFAGSPRMVFACLTYNRTWILDR